MRSEKFDDDDNNLSSPLCSVFTITDLKQSLFLKYNVPAVQ